MYKTKYRRPPPPRARERVIKLRQMYPRDSLTVIGKKCGITRERVRQILNSEKLPTRHICPSCGNPIGHRGILCSTCVDELK